MDFLLLNIRAFSPATAINSSFVSKKGDSLDIVTRYVVSPR